MSTDVIDFQEIEPGIAHIRMQDRAYKNTFSRALVNALILAFKQIESAERYKAVILTGYDNYFATGERRKTCSPCRLGKESSRIPTSTVCPSSALSRSFPRCRDMPWEVGW